MFWWNMGIDRDAAVWYTTGVIETKEQEMPASIFKAVTVPVPTVLTAIEACRAKIEWMDEWAAQEAPHYAEGEWDEMRTEFVSAVDTLTDLIK